MNFTVDDINNIDFKTAGNLPIPIQAGILGVLLIVIIGLGYWFVWSPTIEELDTAKAKETELRETFLSKKRQSINLALYKEQMIEVEKTFGALLRQLPDKSQMDALLTDINQAGLSRGLEFELFKPGSETVGDFYAEMPISIKVIGSYHDLGAFATDISKLSRIVTLNNLSINVYKKDEKDAKDKSNGKLVMEAVAKTYRYLDANETASKKKAIIKPNP